MILKNNKGKEKDFDILFEVEKNSKKYIVYKDPLTNNLYTGRYEDNKLMVLSDDEYNYIKNIIEKFNS